MSGSRFTIGTVLSDSWPRLAEVAGTFFEWFSPQTDKERIGANNMMFVADGFRAEFRKYHTTEEV
jgi:hypothetical protein